MGQTTRVWCDICRCTVDATMQCYGLTAGSWSVTSGDYGFNLQQVCRLCVVRVKEFIDRIKVSE